MDPAVRHLVDRAELHDLVMRYAAGVDRRDWDLIRSCFVPDLKVVDWGQGPFADREAMLDYIKGVAAFHTTMHMMGNQLIEIDGDTASVDTLAMISHELENPDGKPWYLDMSGSRYFERCSRRDGHWVIHQRGGEPVWAPTGVRGLTSDDPAVRWLLDRAETHDLMMHYALGIDHRDWERIRRCFADRFDARYSTNAFDDPDQLIAFIKGVEVFESTTHFLGNQLTEIHGDEALMETYAMITHREAATADRLAREWMAGGSSYHDRLVRQAGAWRIADRGSQVPRVPTGTATVPTSDDHTVRRLLDRALVHDLIVRASFATDRRDDDLLRSCFTDDCVVSLDRQPVTGLTGLVDETHRLNDRWHSTCHFLGNQFVDLHGDEADVETYAYITRRESADAHASAWARGGRRFVDRLRRVDDEWRIVSRRLETNRVAAGVQP